MGRKRKISYVFLHEFIVKVQLASNYRYFKTGISLKEKLAFAI